jgi:hypothetical protein
VATVKAKKMAGCGVASHPAAPDQLAVLTPGYASA